MANDGNDTPDMLTIKSDGGINKYILGIGDDAGFYVESEYPDGKLNLECLECGCPGIEYRYGSGTGPECPICRDSERVKYCPFCGHIPRVTWEPNSLAGASDGPQYSDIVEIVECGGSMGCKANTGWRAPGLALEIWNARIDSGYTVEPSHQDLPDLSHPLDRTDRMFDDAEIPEEYRDDIARLTPTLKLCPFCGGSPAFAFRKVSIFYDRSPDEILIVHCTVCDCQTGHETDDPEEQAIEWNRRDTRPRANDYPRCGGVESSPRQSPT